jgi:hypothetical protein
LVSLVFKNLILITHLIKCYFFKDMVPPQKSIGYSQYDPVIKPRK